MVRETRQMNGPGSEVSLDAAPLGSLQSVDPVLAVGSCNDIRDLVFNPVYE